MYRLTKVRLIIVLTGLLSVLGLQNKVLACHESILTQTSFTDNGNGTFTYVFDVCIGSEDTYGFEITFVGVASPVTSITNPTSSITDPGTGQSMGISSNTGNKITYGDYANSSGTTPVFHTQGSGNICYPMTFTVDQIIKIAEFYGAEKSYNPPYCHTFNYFLDTVCTADFSFYPEDLVFCLGDSITLTDRSYSYFGVDKFEWFVNGVPQGTDSIFIPEFTSPGVNDVTLSVKDTLLGCQDDTIISFFVNAPKIEFNQDTFLVCEETQITIAYQASMLFEPCKLLLIMQDTWGDGWNNGYLAFHNQNNTTIYSATDYGLSSTTTTDSIYITVFNSDSIDIYYSSGIYDSEVRFWIYGPNGSLLYQASSPSPGLQYSLSSPCGNSNSQMEGIWTLSGTTYTTDSLILQPGSSITVELSVTDTSSTFCNITDSVIVLVDQIIVDAGPDTVVVAGSTYTMTGSITGDYNDIYWWVTNTDGSVYTYSGLSPEIIPYTSNYYYFEAEGFAGCQFMDSVYIGTVKDSIIPPSILHLNIPTAFTPNDDGVNDVWNIPDFEQDSTGVLYIYNRWGTLLYSTSADNYRPWDGKYQGNALPTGGYYFLIQSNIETVKGVVTLIHAN